MNEMNNKLINKINNLCDVERELSHVKNERDNLRNDLDISEKNFKDRCEVVEKNTQIIENLKAVKDKYERIN